MISTTTSPFTANEDSRGASETGTLGMRDNGADRAPAQDVVKRVAQGAHDTIDQLAERATPQVQRLQEGYHQTEQMVHRGADQARQLAGEWSDNLRGTVREHPLMSLGTAAVLGMLFARLTR